MKSNLKNYNWITLLYTRSRDKSRHCIKKQRHHFANKGPYSQSYSFSSRCIRLWALDHKEGWVPKNWLFWLWCWTRLFGSPFESKEIKPVNPKWNQPWIIIGRTDAKAETPMLWLLNGKSQLTGKDLGAGKDWRQKEKGVTEDEMVREHHWINGQEFEQTLGDSEG